MAATEPDNGASNVDFIAWDTLQTLLSAPLSNEAYEPLPGASNFEWIMWEILQNIGGGGGGGGLPSGSNGDVLVYDGAWTGSSIIVDSLLNFSIDINKRAFIDEFGTDSVNGADRYLVNSSGIEVVDWESGKLYDSTGETRLSLDKATLQYGGANVLDWKSKVALDDFGGITFDWGEQQFFDVSGNISLDYNSRALYDSNGSLSAAYNNRVLLSGSGIEALNWDSKHLLNGSSVELQWGLSLYGGPLVPAGRKLNVGISNSIDAQKSFNVGGYINYVQPLLAASGAEDAGSIDIFVNNVKYKINVKPG